MKIRKLHLKTNKKLNKLQKIFLNETFQQYYMKNKPIFSSTSASFSTGSSITVVSKPTNVDDM